MPSLTTQRAIFIAKNRSMDLKAVRTTISVGDFGRTLQALGLTSDVAAGAALGVDERTVRRWKNGERGIPGPVAVLVRLWLRVNASRGAVAQAKLLPARVDG